MTDQTYSYPSIAKAIDYTQTYFKTVPKLDEVAESLQLSQDDFQQLFAQWAGTSPTKFFQYTRIEYAKNRLKCKQTTLFETAEESSIAEESRRPNISIEIERMKAAEYKNGGENLSINYSYGQSTFGLILVASTAKGICHLAFIEDKDVAFSVLKSQFPNACFNQRIDSIQQNALHLLNPYGQKSPPIRLHLKGTDFQLSVWECLLKIPMGALSTYGNIANQIEKPTASRAVGTAIGDNPIAFLIPCHRVIQSSGKMSGYRWGTTRKTAIIGWEASRVNVDLPTIL